MGPVNLDPPEKVCRAIGRFIFEFSQLEHELRCLIWDEIDQNGNFFYDVMFAFEVAPLCSMALSIFLLTWKPDKFAVGERIVKRFMAINDLRNRVVHGQWMHFSEDGTLLHTSRHGKGRQYDNQALELEKTAEELKQLYLSLREAARARLDERYGNSEETYANTRREVERAIEMLEKGEVTPKK